MTDYHLAQINIAQAQAAIDSAHMSGFMERIDEINALADKAPGFVWRLQSEAGDATSIQAFDDPAILINMSVWTDIEALKHFVYYTTHVELLKNKAMWFNKTSPHQALWWIPAGQIPAIEEGAAKLALIADIGPSPEAFTFAKPYMPEK